MKKFLNIAIILAMVTISTTLVAQPKQNEYLGLPGDNLNLYAVMKLFQESATLEGFERKLNDENSRINNLDLNGDNLIDYIRVVDYVDKNVHNIVLRVAINKNEDQDVAVFTVQRFRNGQVQVQLIGDEALYGKNYIIEPIYDDQYANETPNPGYSGNGGTDVAVVRTTYYEVADWPLVQYIYMPDYIEWHSSWYWGFYPPYWHPWRPYYWDFYYGYHYNWYNDYYRHYHHCDHYRYDHWNDFYYSSRRSYSPYVSHGIESGHYQATYSHPDQRRQGEALYDRSHHDQGNRRADQYQGNRTDRRQDNQADQYRQQNNSFNTSRRANTVRNSTSNEVASTFNRGADRRSANTFSNRSANNMATTHNTTADRRSVNSFSDRSVASNASAHNTDVARRSSAAANPRSSAKPAPSYNTFSERRASAPRVERPAANPKPSPSFSNSRQVSRPAARAESSSSHRSSGPSQSVRASKSSDSNKSADHGRSNRGR